jgi:hypothetical protein
MIYMYNIECMYILVKTHVHICIMYEPVIDKGRLRIFEKGGSLDGVIDLR